MSQQAFAADPKNDPELDPVDWGLGEHARFEGMPRSNVCLERRFRCVKYACQVCGRKRKSIKAYPFYQCQDCPYKICVDCVLYRPEWRKHVCAPPRS